MPETEEKVGVSMAQLKFIMDNRKYARSKTTRLCNKILGEIQTYDSELRDEKVETLNDLKSKLKSYDSKVTDALWQYESDREKLDNELETCDEYQTRICTIVRKLSNLKFEDIVTMRDGLSFNSTDPLRQTASQLKLPVLPLPEI